MELNLNHSFNVDVALDYGVEAAILIENLAFWINKNKANNNNFYDGRYWTYNSAKAFVELFPYWSSTKIQRLLAHLETEGVIISGNYNKLAYDRTKWYSIVDEAILQKYTFHSAKMNNGLCKTAQPIPDINTNINTDKFIPQLPADLLSDYLKVRKAKKAGELTKTCYEGIEREAKLAGITTEQALKFCCERGWVGFKASWLEREKNDKADNNWRSDDASIMSKAKSLNIYTSGKSRFEIIAAIDKKENRN